MDKATQCSPAPSPRPALVDAVVGTDDFPEDIDTTQPASHAHVDTADATAQCSIPQPERYLQFNPKHAPIMKHAEYLWDTDLVSLGVASPATVYRVELCHYGKEPTAAKKTLEHLNQCLPRIVATRTVPGKRKNFWVTNCEVPAARLHHLLLACTLNEALLMSATIGSFKRPENGQWYEYTVTRSLPLRPEPTVMPRHHHRSRPSWAPACCQTPADIRLSQPPWLWVVCFVRAIVFGCLRFFLSNYFL